MSDSCYVYFHRSLELHVAVFSSYREMLLSIGANKTFFGKVFGLYLPRQISSPDQGYLKKNFHK